MDCIFAITIEEVQYIALKKIGRKLTDDELRTVRKGIGFGLECWEEVVTYAINDAIEQKF